MQTPKPSAPNLTILPPVPAKAGDQSGSPTPGPVVVEATAIPTTKAELNALLTRKSELSNQLNSVQGRRNSLARQLQSQSGVSRVGIENRMVLLDQRLMQLERDIQTNSSLIAQAPPVLAGTTASTENFPMGPDTVVPIGVVFTLFVMAPIAFSFARLLWRRANRPAALPPSPASEARLERVEQSVDAIAIEIERITEGQRFITQLLSKANSAPALGVGQAPAEPIRVAGADAVPVMADRLRR